MKLRWLTGFLIIAAFVTQMLVMIPSGSRYCYQERCGDYFWGVHEHDGIWHLALANAAFRGLPLEMPSNAGEKLTGYNWLIDLPLYGLAKIGIPPSVTYFKILPLLWFGLMIWAWKKFAQEYGENREVYWQWLLFWLFFGNSLSFLLTLWHNGTLSGGSALIAMQAPMMLINLQFAYTLPILAGVATILVKNFRHSRAEITLMSLAFLAMGLKFYGGVIILAWIGIQALLTRNWRRMVAAGITGLVAIIVFYQPQGGGEAILRLAPLATVYPIIEEKMLFYSPMLATARYAPELLKQMIAGLMAIVIFIIFNFGGRLIGLLRLRKLSVFEKSVVWTILVAVAANMLLVQRGEWWNTVQFLYYGFFLMNILTAKELSAWSQVKTKAGEWLMILSGVLVVTCIPNAIDTWKVFGKYPPGSYVSDREKEVLTTLAKLPDGVVLALPLARSEVGSGRVPEPLYLRYESSYVAAYTGKLTYFNDTVQSRLVGLDYQRKRDQINGRDCQVLNEVSYIYVAGDEQQIEGWEQCPRKIELIEGNTEARVYRVR